jgi:hypothetical protein
MKLVFPEIKKKSKLSSIKCDWNTVYMASASSLFLFSFLYFYNLFTFSTPDVLSPPPRLTPWMQLLYYMCVRKPAVFAIPCAKK